ncbi:hypothetical protein ACWEQ8_27630 [Streptomyces noursei]
MPTSSSSPSWIGDLNSSLSSLRLSADRARHAYQGAEAAASALRQEAARADANTDDTVLHAATVLCEGYQRTQYPSVLAQIAFAHQSLATSLARVWRNAAIAYAYGLAMAQHDLRRGRTPQRASFRQDSAVPAPPGDDQELVAGYQAALDCEYAVVRSGEPNGAACWAGCAEQWQSYAARLDRRVWRQLKLASSW